MLFGEHYIVWHVKCRCAVTHHCKALVAGVQDTDDMDYLLPQSITELGNCLMQLAATLIFVSIVQPIFLAGLSFPYGPLPWTGSVAPFLKSLPAPSHMLGLQASVSCCRLVSSALRAQETLFEYFCSVPACCMMLAGSVFRSIGL